MLVAGLCTVVVAAAAPPPAAATDLDELRSRAQRLGDEVTALEHRLESLRAEQADLEDDIVAVTQQIGELELERTQAVAAEQAARDAFVGDAVEIYKNGSSVANLDLLLSAQDVSDLELFLEIGSAARTRAEHRLRRAEAERARAEAAQMRLDDRKERLMAAKARVSEVAAGISDAIATRREALRSLTREIDRLERRARRMAARASQPSKTLDLLLGGGGPGGPARGIPDGYVATGVSFEGVASWYGPGFEGNPTASGAIFDPGKFTAASKELPLGTWLYVEHEGSGVVVLVNDRGPYIDGRVLDLSEAAAQAIGITGLGWVYAEILIKK
ncbi:MAG TPA: septal ring lytic transglycosylase RlpA family protein [Actinomycetota bacterium]|nr:septal ring lytic transglycosylase RlpA family protein [Actinomycetota bacterium]